MSDGASRGVLGGLLGAQDGGVLADVCPDAAPLVLLRHAAGRELKVLRTAPPGTAARRAVVRVHPPRGHGGRVARVRAALAGGALDPTGLAAVARDAGVAGLPARLSAGSGGALLAFTSRRGRPVVLRIGPAGDGGDPRRSIPTLRRLEAAGVDRVPRPLAEGVVEHLAWTLEERLTGRSPSRVDAALLAEAGAFCAELPRSPEARFGAALEPPLDLAGAGARYLPDLARRCADVLAAVRERLDGLPPVAGHGDLWAGNLLVEQGHLVGVVDWDAFREAAVPGVDLLHLAGTARRRAAHRSLGAEVLTRPWVDPRVAEALTQLWRGLGIEVPPSQRSAVGLAWWACQAGADLARNPGLAGNRGWVQANVVDVLDAWPRLLAG